ncbi:hypothetical protein ACSFB5_12375, partial [Glaesserella parasuis]|uniref:hypothetical protein n=1 Tax=Glaesserella parasuis TaxID=738 RepID=UPI003F3A7915
MPKFGSGSTITTKYYVLAEIDGTIIPLDLPARYVRFTTSNNPTDLYTIRITGIFDNSSCADLSDADYYSNILNDFEHRVMDGKMRNIEICIPT